MTNLSSHDALLKKLLANPRLIETEIARRREQFRTLFPDDGPLRRALYPKHLEFFRAGATFPQRLFMAANRIGKSVAGAYETTCHATGLYPAWWDGKRFNCPTDGWACGTNSETTRNVVQGKLLGPVTPEGTFVPGTGIIPADRIVDYTLRRNALSGSVETIWIRHESGGTSRITLKTYEQGRKSFEGDAKHYIWDDEEPDEDIYTEQLYRTLTTLGVIYTTFTPLQGMSTVVTGFLDPSPEARAVKFYVQAGWADVPHLDGEAKKALLAGTPPYQVKARTLGEPSLGAGAIYPIAEEDVLLDDFTIPETWMRVYALDVGWNRTACLWGARDPGNGRIVLYDEHYQGMGEPASHALAIKARGDWIKGVIDPAARGRSQVDGKQLLNQYQLLGLDLAPAINAVEAGLTGVWQALVSGQLKAQKHLTQWRREFGRYHRDEKGNIPAQDDHLMDDTRYLWMSGRDRLTLRPREDDYSGDYLPRDWRLG